MVREFDFNTIRAKLRDTNSYKIEYRVLHNGAPEWHEMSITHIVGDEVDIETETLKVTAEQIEDTKDVNREIAEDILSNEGVIV